MRNVPYTDEEGYKWVVAIPENAPDEHASMGLKIGPPSMEVLELPFPLDRRLNNELFNRGFITYKDVAKRRNEFVAVWQAVLKTDVVRLIELFQNAEPPEPKSKKVVAATSSDPRRNRRAR